MSNAFNIYVLLLSQIFCIIRMKVPEPTLFTNKGSNKSKIILTQSAGR